MEKHIYKTDDPIDTGTSGAKRDDPNFSDLKRTNKHAGGNTQKHVSKIKGVSYMTGGKSSYAKRMLRGENYIKRLLFGK